jgi:hypothetical protein
LTSRRPRSGLKRRAFGSTASLHKAGPKQSPPKGGRRHGPRTRRAPPAGAHPPGSPGRRSKVTGSSPAQGSRPGRPPRLTRACAPSSRRARPSTTPPRGPRPPPFRCLSRDPSRRPRIPSPLHLSKDHPSSRDQSSRSNPWVRGTSGHGREPGQALTIAPDRVCRASRAPVQGPFGALAQLTVFLMTTARCPCRWFAARPRVLLLGSLDRLRPPPDEFLRRPSPALAWPFHTFSPAGDAARSLDATQGRRSGPALAATAYPA